MKNAAMLLALAFLVLTHFGCAESKVNHVGAASDETYYSVAVSSADFFITVRNKILGPTEDWHATRS